jgi:hypothetical protein
MPEATAVARISMGGPGGRTPHPTGFVMHLLLKQEQLKMGYGEFARHLGMDRSLWYMLRQGDREPSLALVQRVMRLWPGEFEEFLPELVLRHRAGSD